MLRRRFLAVCLAAAVSAADALAVPPPWARNKRRRPQYVSIGDARDYAEMAGTVRV